MRETLELWLVRHGETTRSVVRQIAGWSDPILTEKGRSEAAALRPLLEGEDFVGVWSSDLQRTVSTAQLAWGDAVADRRLRELNFGDLEEKPFAAINPTIAQQARAFKDFCAPGGESIAELRCRLLSFLADLVPGRHLVFTHGGVIRTLTQGLGLDRFVVTGSLVGIDWPGSRLLFVKEPAEAVPVFDE